MPWNSRALDDRSTGGFEGVHPEVCPLRSPAGGFPPSSLRDHRELKAGRLGSTVAEAAAGGGCAKEEEEEEEEEGEKDEE